MKCAVIPAIAAKTALYTKSRNALYLVLICGRGVARLTRPPVTGKIAGSNPVGRATRQFLIDSECFVLQQKTPPSAQGETTGPEQRRGRGSYLNVASMDNTLGSAGGGGRKDPQDLTGVAPVLLVI